MTESKMETKTFAELRVVALWPDRQEMDSLTWREITPRGAEDFSAEFYCLAGILWLPPSSTLAQWLALFPHRKRIPDFLPTLSPLCVALASFAQLKCRFLPSTHSS